MINLIELVYRCLQCLWLIDPLGANVLTSAWQRNDFVQPIHNEISGFKLSTLHGGKQDLLLRHSSAGLHFPSDQKWADFNAKRKGSLGHVWITGYRVNQKCSNVFLLCSILLFFLLPQLRAEVKI